MERERERDTDRERETEKIVLFNNTVSCTDSTAPVINPLSMSMDHCQNVTDKEKGRTRRKTCPGDTFPSKVQHRIVSDRTRDSPVRGRRTKA